MRKYYILYSGTCSGFPINSEDVSLTIPSPRDTRHVVTAIRVLGGAAIPRHTHTREGIGWSKLTYYGRAKDRSQRKMGCGVRPLRGSQGTLRWPPISEGKMRPLCKLGRRLLQPGPPTKEEEAS
jgi:hypothetical protein